MKTSNEIISEIIQGTIECWKITSQEECDLHWQLTNMVGKCFEELGRDVTNERKCKAFTLATNKKLYGEREYLNGKEIISLEYKCLFGNTHKVAAEGLEQLNSRMKNDNCKCGIEDLNTV
jgi:hypothetical protein